MQNMVSVIIPVYNREKYIEECVQSVLNQSYQNFEIILIDDGSSDRSPVICKELSKKDARIRFFISEHCGVSGARNQALEKARGEFVFFLDSDDYIHPRLFEVMVKAFENSDASIAATDVRGIYEKNWKVALPALLDKKEAGETIYKSHLEAIDDMFRSKSPLSCIGGTLMRKSLIGETTFLTNLFIGEDFYFLYQNLIKNASCIFLKKKWYYVRNHQNNTSWQYDFNAFWTRFHRRELVWQSEEALGRTEYVNMQKRDAFGCFLGCIKHNKPKSLEAIKIRKVMKKYRKALFPAFNLKMKAYYFLSVYLPCIYSITFGSQKK